MNGIMDRGGICAAPFSTDVARLTAMVGGRRLLVWAAFSNKIMVLTAKTTQRKSKKSSVIRCFSPANISLIHL